MTFVIFLVVIFVVGLIAVMVANSNEKERRDAAVSARTDFTESKVVKDDHASFHFAVDESRQEVFCYSKGNTIRFKYQDIVTVEIKIDGDTVVSKKSASIGGALAGGLIAGGLGAVVGGSSMGNSKSSRKVTAVNVHILLRDSNVDSFDVQCLAFESKSDEMWYKTASQNAQAIFDILRIAMDKVQMEAIHSVKVETSAPKSSIEELKELAELKRQGLVTDEEFATMKAKILSK
jgi:hypothetical protein